MYCQDKQWHAPTKQSCIHPWHLIASHWLTEWTSTVWFPGAAPCSGSYVHTCKRVRTSASGYDANWAMEDETMPAPSMASGGGEPSYSRSKCSLMISNAAMSTPAYGRMPICGRHIRASGDPHASREALAGQQTAPQQTP